MKSYILKKNSGVPHWENIPALEINVPYLERADIQAWARLCWDDSGIHVNLQAREANIRCQETGPLPVICEDSCLEFFIRPTQAMSYFNFEWNPACGLWLGHGWNAKQLIRLAVTEEKDDLFHPQSYKTDDGWGITFHIPFAFIRHFFPDFKAYEGLEFHGNCYKCGDCTVQPHFLSWNPIDLDKQGQLSFHAPEYFGRMILGGSSL